MAVMYCQLAMAEEDALWLVATDLAATHFSMSEVGSLKGPVRGHSVICLPLCFRA